MEGKLINSAAVAIGMCMSLDLHREAPASARLSPAERELRRHLFWTCYLIDRLNACGSKRPSFISDESTLLRLPSWAPHPGAAPLEGDFFSIHMNFQHHPETGQIAYGSIAMLIDIARILGSTNKYLANGGVKGDKHFPWHASSALSRIRQELEVWASGNHELFRDLNAVLSRPDNIALMLSKLIFHLIHCLVYRPFLPIDLAELQGSGQHQSWQIEATNLCFIHANAIIETILVAKQSASIEWPSFVGYCLSSAGTVHVHGAHYRGQEREVYSLSADFLSQEMQMLSELRYKWAGIQHQKDTLQNLYVCHSDLVKTLASSPLRFSSVFHLEDFFDRYPGRFFDGAHVSLRDVTVEAPQSKLVHHPVLIGYIADPRSSLSPKPHDLQNPLLSNQLPSSTSPGTASSEDLQQPILKQRIRQNTTDSAIALSTISPVDDKASQFGPLVTSPITRGGAPFDSLPTPPILSSTFTTSFPLSPLQSSLDQSSFYPFPPDAATAPGATPVHPGLNIDAASFGNDINGVNVFEQALQQGQQSVMTPGGLSQGSTAVAAGGGDDKDPFLTLLEQLAENEQSRGGPSDLDFFLGEGNG